jgi:hypothetical protein
VHLVGFHYKTSWKKNVVARLKVLTAIVILNPVPWDILVNRYIYFFSLALRPSAGHGLLILEVF